MPYNFTDDSKEVDFIKKLEIPERFNAIKTGYKTLAPLNQHEKDTYGVIWTYFKQSKEIQLPKEKNSILWVAENYEKVQEYLEKRYVPENDYKESSIRNRMEGLANLLLAIDKNKFKDIVRPYFIKGLQMQKKLDAKKGDNLLEPKEEQNWVSYGMLCKNRDELYDAWTKDPKNVKKNMNHLVLALNTYVPPVRLNYVEAMFWGKRWGHGDSEPPKGINESNYIWEYSPGKFALVMNNDKIEGKRQAHGDNRQIMPFDQEISGVTNGKQLNEILNDSLKYLPRKYVLQAVNVGGPMGKSSYDKAIQATFSPQKPTQNIIRKAYVNYWHRSKPELSDNVKKEIAKRMRHTLGVAQHTYYKINLPVHPDDNYPSSTHTKPHKAIHVDEPVRLTRVTRATANVDAQSVAKPTANVNAHSFVINKKTANKAPLFDPVKYSQEYRQKNKADIKKKRQEAYKDDDKKNAILRAKVLHNLNNGLTKNPRKATLERYDIKYNEQQNLYY